MATVLRPSLRGGAELRGTAALLRRMGRVDLQREVAKAVKAEGKPTLDDLRASARSVRVSGVRTGSPRRFVHGTAPKRLRERMAAATVLEFRANQNEARVSFHTDSSRMGDAKVIPRYIDLGKPWRHPIMGNRSRWAVSKGESWFFPPIKKHLPEFRQRIDAVLDEIVAKVEES